MKINLDLPFGLGDLAYWIFRPFVYFTDFVWGTDLKDCEVCKARRERWNSWGMLPRWVILIVTLLMFYLCI